MLHHPKHHKLTVAKTLIHRDNTFVFNRNYIRSELFNIHSILRFNKFSTRAMHFSSHQIQISAPQLALSISIPFVLGILEKN